MVAITHGGDVVERPIAPGASSEVGGILADSSVAKAGDGASEFKKIASASEEFAKNGIVSNLSIAMDTPASAAEVSPGAENVQNLQGSDRQTQIQNLRNSMGNFDLNAGIAPDKREAFAASVIDTTNRIVGLPPGSPEIQGILQNAVTEFQKNNPQVDASVFARAMQSAFRDTPGAQSLRAIFTSNSIGVRDATRVSDANPSGMVGAVFTGDTSTREGQMGKVAFDTAQKLAQLGHPIDFESDSLSVLQSQGLTAPVPDMPPRARPENSPGSEQLLSQMKARHPSIPDSALQGLLKEADTLAFGTPARQMGERFTTAIDALSAANPNIDRLDLTRLLTQSLNKVTQSDDFDIQIAITPPVTILQDKRLATGANPRGGVGAALTESADGTQLAQEFKDALKVAGILRDGRARFDSDLSREDFKRFLGDVRNDTFFLRFNPFGG